MKNAWLLLLVGLAVGVAFFAINFVGGTPPMTSPEEAKPETKNRIQPENYQSEYEETETEVGGEVESLDFKVDVTNNGRDLTYRFRIDNPETEEEDIRIDQRRADGSEFNVILRHGRDEGWFKDYSSDRWNHFTGFAFTQMARTRAEDYSAYKVTDWKEMEGETFTLDTEDGSARVYDVRVNERIPESVFNPA